MPLSYDELLRKYNELLSECERLTAKNIELRRKLADISEPVIISAPESAAQDDPATATVNMRSAPEEKIALFRTLFRGREDVFARRWESKTTGRCGYQPVCGNEWAEGFCDKKKYKCRECPNRKLLCITERDYYDHLAGKDELCRDVIGIYPMLTDETCFFLCADFDDEDHRVDALAYMKICGEYGIPAYMERSRSGNGIHVWIFFDNAVAAKKARMLGTSILTKAMSDNPSLSFKSYDRLLPNQDTMPEGGFGNLIALPLQGRARQNGNSVFVDSDFRLYPDQWAFLSAVEKLTPEKLDDIIPIICGNSDLGELMSEEETKPWETKQTTVLSYDDFPENISVIRSNMLYVPTENISTAAVNRIKRLAAFKNPDFYRAQSMRMSVYDKPRVICAAERFDKYIAIPRGCENALIEMLTAAGTAYSIEDKTNPGHSISVRFNGTLREEQKPAADALLQHDNGVLSATTAFGKTVIASYIISERNTNTLVLVHTQALLRQWQTSLEQFLTFDIVPPEKTGKGRPTKWSPVGIIGAQKNTLRGNVDVAVMQSLTDGDEVKELVRNYGMIIVDECHHISAVNFERILRYANTKYVYGLTATPTRRDGHHPIIFMQCGPIRYKVDAKAQAEKRGFEHYIIPRFTSIRSVATIASMDGYYKLLMENTVRNQLIISDVAEALKRHRTPIILTERRDHITILAEMLKPYCDNIVTLCGGSSEKLKKGMIDELNTIQPDQTLVIVATGKYVGEGFDYPRLDTLFLALPISWKGKVAQYAGRLHRDYQGKTEVQIYDYVDIHIPLLEKMYQRRLNGYASIGYKAKPVPTTELLPELIYDGKSFYPVYVNDIQTAKREIIIVSPFMRINRLRQMIRVLSEAMLNGAAVTVVTRPPEDYLTEAERQTAENNLEYIRGYSINIILKSGFHQKYAIIDQRVVWYGSVNFLSFGTNDESVMRLDSADIAGQLTDTVMP